MKKTSYINKRTLNPFFKKTNSTPQDLVDWVEFLMKKCSDMEFPCNKGYFYMDKWSIGNFPSSKSLQIAGINIAGLRGKRGGFGAATVWGHYVDGDRNPLLDAIKEFKEKYEIIYR